MNSMSDNITYEKIDNAQVAVGVMATIDGLEHRVMQSFSFNVANDYYQYGLQYVEKLRTMNIFKSLTTSMYDWEYSSPDNIIITMRKYIELSGFLGGHTQTLLQNGGTVITGLRHYAFDNLKSLLDKASFKQHQDFMKNPMNNPTWTAFNDYLKNQSQDEDISPEQWSRNFIGLRNESYVRDPIDGQYVIIKGVDDLVKNAKRSELALSTNGTCLLAVNDTDNNLHLFVFESFDLFSRIGAKLDDIGVQRGIYWEGNGFPTLSNISNDKEFQQALDFYKAVLNADDLVFDLSQQLASYTKVFNASDIRKNVSPDGADLSYQGFGIDWKGNIYVSSGFGPDHKSAKLSAPHIYKIVGNTWYDLDCYNLFTPASSESDSFYPEIENIQVLDPDCLLVAVAKHNNFDPNEQVAINQVYRVKW